MKPSELQIGDWVMFKNPRTDEFLPSVVDEIRIDGTVLLAELDGDLLCVDDIYPIPLTAEILEKNGFAKMSNSPYVMLYMWSTGGVAEFADVTIQVGQDHADKWRWDCLTLKIHLYKGDITLHKIRYVHQLQHALRLCGIEKEIEL